jgi:esterase/lipase
MNYEEILIPYGRANEHIVAWHHPAPSKTLILLIHGHSSTGDKPRFVTLANTLQQAGYAVVRFTVLREKVGDEALLTMTVTEEAAQADVVLQHFRDEYEQIVAVGHSQGGMIALDLGVKGAVDGIVFLMSVMDVEKNTESKLAAMGITLEELHARKHIVKELPNGAVFVYTPAFFDDYQTWDVLGMLAQWYGPSLFVSATKDVNVPADEVELGFNIAGDPKELFSVEDEHRFSNETAQVIAMKIVAWLEENNFPANDSELH